jgi:hypothetical protein
MNYRGIALLGWLSTALFLPSNAQQRNGNPETVMITLHAKPGAEAELEGVLAKHWAAIRLESRNRRGPT